MRLFGSIAVPIGLGAVAAVVMITLGLQPEFAWGWGVVVAAVVVGLRLRMPDDPGADAPGRRDERAYVGSDVSRLAWAINLSGDTVSEAVTRRVRAILRRRLARHGIDLDDERQTDAVEQRLGPGLWARLNGRGTGVEDIREALSAAERLATTDITGTTDATHRESTDELR